MPYLANKIVKENKNHPSVHINLVSAAIGNGLVNLHEQVPGYYEFARINNYIGLVEEGVLEAASLACQGLISTVGGAAIVECNLYMAAVMEAISLNVGYQINPYNVKIPCAVEPLCYDFSNMTRFLDDPAVKKAIGAGSSPQTWAPCNFKVHGFLTADWVTDCSTQLPDVLEAGVRVVVYNGMLDYIVNWVTSRDVSLLLTINYFLSVLHSVLKHQHCLFQRCYLYSGCVRLIGKVKRRTITRQKNRGTLVAKWPARPRLPVFKAV